MQSIVCDFRIEQMMHYSLFVPRLYNLCLSMGFQAEIIDLLMQQSDENPDQVDLEDAIHQMIDAREIKIIT